MISNKVLDGSILGLRFVWSLGLDIGVFIVSLYNGGFQVYQSLA